jgi:alanine-synthesizing transaminase
VFSRRIPWSLETNEYSRLLEAKRQSGVRILDLTESNPTRAQIDYPEGLLQALSDERGLRYQPLPAGMVQAREAVAALEGVPVERVLLTASTSESYSYLFKLLCDPGDRVLVPRPSYPLFEFLATLESVEVAQYSLRFDSGWSIDFESVRALVTPRTRAILLVNPNNPTGSFVKPEEVEELARLCAERDLALVSDEVFSCYPLDTSSAPASWNEVERHSLVFRLNGLSKMAGLPQMKLGWIIVGGPESLRHEAFERLELIADTFLSAGTPVQHALPALFEAGASVREQIQQRTARNLEWLRSVADPLPVEGGWCAILHLPETHDEYEFVLALLEEDGVLVQPGFFYDFEAEGYLVLSLLTPEADFREGVSLILKRFRGERAASMQSSRDLPSDR